MVKPLLGRLWFAGTAVVVAIEVLVQLVAAKAADFLLHTASPLMCVFGWLAAGAHLLDRRLDDRLATRLSRAVGR